VVKVLLSDTDSANVQDPRSVFKPKIRQCNSWVLCERRTLSFSGSASVEGAMWIGTRFSGESQGWESASNT
jgi:hypothetical protein